MSFLKNLRGLGGKIIDLSTPKAKTFRSGGPYAPIKTIPGNPDVLHRPMMRDIIRSTAAKALRAQLLEPTMTKGVIGKAVAVKGLGALAGPVAGAALGAMELKRNIPILVKGVPAYMKERKALKESRANLKSLRAQAAIKLKKQ